MADRFTIRRIYTTFNRHDRRYSLFSVLGLEEDFLYYSHMFRPLRSLMIGRDFNGQLTHLMENEDVCIECGLGLSMTGGVALDEGEIIDWNYPISEANQVLVALRETLGKEGDWVRLF